MTPMTADHANERLPCTTKLVSVAILGCTVPERPSRYVRLCQALAIGVPTGARHALSQTALDLPRIMKRFFAQSTLFPMTRHAKALHAACIPESLIHNSHPKAHEMRIAAGVRHPHASTGHVTRFTVQAGTGTCRIQCHRARRGCRRCGTPWKKNRQVCRAVSEPCRQPLWSSVVMRYSWRLTGALFMRYARCSPTSC